MQNEKTSQNKKSIVLEATPEDYPTISKFLNQNNLMHRHLDWFSPLDWLGVQPFLMLMENQKIGAVLCATPESKNSAWIRTFAIKKRIPLEEAWQQLLSKAVIDLKLEGVKQLASLAISTWFEGLLTTRGFENRQNIVVLEWGGNLPVKNKNQSEYEIRPMHRDDISEVHIVDNLAFSPLWQNSQASLLKAYEQPGISTVAIHKEKIIGYQISTSMTIYGHLARLAVLPEYQRTGIAFGLVYNLLQQFDQQGYWRVTVNTQSTNLPSLKLYEKFGFKRTGEEIPVYELSL
jgi:ribosomal protein S18 acetylase RimI-like enzyme